MASNDGIIWITYRGRKIPIKPGMNGKFNKKKLDEIRDKKEAIAKSNKDASYELTSDDPNRYGDKMRKVNDFNKSEEEASAKRTEERFIKEYAKKNGMSEEYVRNSINANKSDSQKLLDTVKKNKVGREYRDKLNKISDKSIPDGTYDVDTGKAVDFKGEGYNVSFEQSGVQLTNDEYYDRIEECRNKCDGKVYAGKFGGDPEISFYTKDKKVALELMEKYNQHSIWDNSIGDIIENPNYDESKNKVNYKAPEVKLKSLSDYEQYYIEQGYSKATALKRAKEEINKRKK